jgi:rhodanese-related sulfurtransferase/predicted transcriptional regulator
MPWLTPSRTLGDHPGPGGRPDQQQRHRDRDDPAGHEHRLAAEPVHPGAGDVVGGGLGEPEDQDEGQARGVVRHAEDLPAQQRHHGALLAEHAAHQGVDRDQQHELGQVLSQAKGHPGPGAGGHRHLPHVHSSESLNRTAAGTLLSRDLLNGWEVAVAQHNAKSVLFDALTESAKALANGRRAELIDILAQGERSVEELAAEIGQSVANTSQHLQRLLRSGLVRSRRQGNRIYYCLSSPAVWRLWRAMRETAEQHVADLQRIAEDYLGDRGSLATISRDDLVERLRAGDVVLLDVRPEPEYAAGHIPGALSIPLQTLEARLDEIPAGVEIVAYCRGPYCVYADEAVRLFSATGRSASRLEDGFPEWVAADLPVDRAQV